jgi:hypothetical protein
MRAAGAFFEGPAERGVLAAFDALEGGRAFGTLAGLEVLPGFDDREGLVDLDGFVLVAIRGA